MRILLALGGNALLRRGEPATPPGQERSVKVAAAEIAGIAEEHEVVVTHGNGPRVGQMLELALRNELPERDVVSVLTEVVVTAGGPDGESSCHSVTPQPQAIAAIRSLRVLVDSGALVVCADRRPPIVLDGLGTMLRVETDLDRDLTAALLARRLDADLLVMLTGVDPDLTAGPMAPKVEAACRFAETTGRRAAIGALADVDRVVRGEAGTQVAAGEGGRVATR